MFTLTNIFGTFYEEGDVPFITIHNTTQFYEVMIQNMFHTYGVLLLLTIMLVYGIQASTYFKRNYEMYQDEEYARLHSTGYYKLAKTLEPYIEQLSSIRLDVLDITFKEGYYTIVYRMHGTLHTVKTNNVKILAVDAEQLYLKAKCINLDIMYGYMQYDLYDIEIALTEPLDLSKYGEDDDEDWL